MPVAFSGFNNAWSWRFSAGLVFFLRTQHDEQRWYIISRQQAGRKEMRDGRMCYWQSLAKKASLMLPVYLVTLRQCSYHLRESRPHCDSRSPTARVTAATEPGSPIGIREALSRSQAATTPAKYLLSRICHFKSR